MIQLNILMSINTVTSGDLDIESTERVTMLKILIHGPQHLQKKAIRIQEKKWNEGDLCLVIAVLSEWRFR